MKKIRTLLILAIMMVLAFFLFACGRSDANNGPVDVDEDTDVEMDEDFDDDMEEDLDDDEESDYIDIDDIDWHTEVYTIEDQDGYTFEIWYTISPWMLVSDNEDLIREAWDYASGGEYLPYGFDDWYLEDEGNYMSRDGIHRGSGESYMALGMNDMYYCVGYLYIENVTEGWDITDDRVVETILSWGEDPGMYIRDVESQVIGRMYYSNDFEDFSNCVWTRALLKDNDWGPRPFIIMAPENFTPKYPDGEYLNTMIESPFNLSHGSERYHFNVGVYGKDGQYYGETAE